MTPLLEGRALRKTHRRGQQEVVAVDDVDIVVHAGERVGLVGESGSGKSSLGRLLLRLDEPDAGEVLLDGASVTARRGRALLPFRRRCQVVFQDPSASLNPRMTVEALVEEGLRIHDLHAADRAARVGALLAEVGLKDEALRRRRPHELSGGQKQRVGIARALAVEPEFLLLDEPVSALDVSVQAQVINTLMHLSKSHALAMLFVAHDLHVVRHVCDRICVMHRGRIVEDTSTEALFATPQHPYTRALLEAVPGHRRNVGAGPAMPRPD